MSRYTIALIEGDGIGREVIPAARTVLQATGLSFDFIEAEAGWETFNERGVSVPEETLKAVYRADATLFGAVSSPSEKVPGYYSAIRYLRQEMGLFANIRPAKSRPLAGMATGIDMLIVRENTEGLYYGVERTYANGEVAVAERVVTRGASTRIARFAFEKALQRRKRLAVVHKANVLSLSDGLFLQAVGGVAQEYPQVETETVIVDACAMRLVRHPASFDVLVMENMFGDILSDVSAGVTGGLGLAPSGNIGTKGALFEPVHGSAPDIAGMGVANPIAAILSAALMLDHLGERQAAKAIENAVNTALSNGILTPDLGGSASTEEVAEKISETTRSILSYD